MGSAALLLVVTVVCFTCDASDKETAVPPDCQARMDFGSACKPCLESHCCAEIAACAESLDCMACMLPTPEFAVAACEAAFDLADGLTRCLKESCVEVCPSRLQPVQGPSEPACDPPEPLPAAGDCVGTCGQCNPVTAEPCKWEEGWTCDLSAGYGPDYQCFEKGNVNDLCEPCGYHYLDFCRHGLTCAGRCVRYCCADAPGDCGAGNHCDSQFVSDYLYGEPTYDSVGICLKGERSSTSTSGGAGAAGAGGSGGGGGAGGC